MSWLIYTLRLGSTFSSHFHADVFLTFTSDRYTSSLQALSHALILAPQNPFFLLQAGETAYTSGDINLALKYLLGVIDLVACEDQEEDKVPQGIEVRAWWGVKLVRFVLLFCSCMMRLIGWMRIVYTPVNEPDYDQIAITVDSGYTNNAEESCVVG